jgi:phosphomethylpyrimidine synthase
MTQLEQARRGKITAEMEEVAAKEKVPPETLRRRIARGTAVIPANVNRRNRKICGIGEGLSVKVNANIGTSPDLVDIEREMTKLKAAEDAKADTFMDLSTGGDVREIRRKFIVASALPIGTVPIYEAAVRAVAEHRSIADMTPDSMIQAIQSSAEDGVDFVTVHCGVTKRLVDMAREGRRITGIVSRGGTFLAEWIGVHEKENPYYERYDEILDIARKYDVTLSLGDGLRPGCLADSFDDLQIGELAVLAQLARRAFEAGVQVIIEGPGHVPLDQVAAQVALQKKLCNGAPFYVLGPLVTDIAPGYDHITGAIGGALAAMAGADFLCYVTPSEHLGLPDANDVREGVIASRIAAHAADVARKIPGARDWDDDFSKDRALRNWQAMIEKCINPAKAAEIRSHTHSRLSDVCTMCGEFCTYRIARQKKSEG